MTQFYNFKNVIRNDNYNVDKEGWLSCIFNNDSSVNKYINYYTNNLNLKVGNTYLLVLEIKQVSGNGTLYLTNTTSGNGGQFTNTQIDIANLSPNSILLFQKQAIFEEKNRGLNTNIVCQPGNQGNITFRISVLDDLSITEDNFIYTPYITKTGIILGQTDIELQKELELKAPKKKSVTTSITTSSWSDTAPYTKTIAVSGLLETDIVNMYPVYSSTASTRATEREEYAKISMVESQAGSIKITCDEEIPTISLNIRLEVYY